MRSEHTIEENIRCGRLSATNEENILRKSDQKRQLDFLAIQASRGGGVV